MQTERSKRSIVKEAFGPDATIRESSGLVEIRSAGALLGSGRTVARALADALAFSMRGVRRADQMEVQV